MDGMKVVLEVKSKSISKYRTMEVDLKSKIEDYKKTLDEMKATIKNVGRRLESLSLHELE